MDVLNYTTPPSWRYTIIDFTHPELIFSIPTTLDLNIEQLPTTTSTPATNPVLDNITFALRVVLFLTCLVENSIAVFILHKNIRNGRQTFAQFMLINIACVDILTTIIYYSAMFVTFSHGRFVWLVQGLIGDILCKLFNFFLNGLLGKILILSLVALACDAARNSSRKGRKEHSKKFNLICTVLFWLIAAGFSAIYLKISKIQPNSQFYECSTVQGSEGTVTMLNIVHAYIFVGAADVILMIVDLVVFIRVRRRRKEMRNRRPKREKESGKYHTKMGRQRRVGVQKNVEILDEMSPDEVDQEVHSITSRESGADIEGSDQQSETSSISSVEFIEMSSATENVNIPKNIEATVIRITKASAINERHAKRKKRSRPQPPNGNDDVESPGAINDAGQSAQKERFKTTRKEAKIMGVISSLFVILSLTQLILIMVCPSCSVYLFYAIQMALEIYAVIKPGIYASIDKEFRKKYKQLSPIACCCFRRIRCHTVQQVRTIH